MTPFDPLLHNRPGQSLPPARQGTHVPSAPLPSLTHSTTTMTPPEVSIQYSVFSYSTSRMTLSLVSPDPKTSPFAAVVTSSGPMAKTNPFRFSTKWWDEETDLGWWGYRWYGESRWLSRDPIEEMGGMNLYSYVSNVPICLFDFLGLLLPSPIGPSVTPEEGQSCCPDGAGNPKFSAKKTIRIRGYFITFELSDITQTSGGEYYDLKEYWWNCFRGYGPGTEYQGAVLTQFADPKVLGGAAIAYGTFVRYLWCDNNTKTWIRDTNVPEGNLPKLALHYRFGLEFMGSYWTVTP